MKATSQNVPQKAREAWRTGKQGSVAASWDRRPGEGWTGAARRGVMKAHPPQAQEAHEDNKHKSTTLHNTKHKNNLLFF